MLNLSVLGIFQLKYKTIVTPTQIMSAEHEIRSRSQNSNSSHTLLHHFHFVQYMVGFNSVQCLKYFQCILPGSGGRWGGGRGTHSSQWKCLVSHHAPTCIPVMSNSTLLRQVGGQDYVLLESKLILAQLWHWQEDWWERIHIMKIKVDLLGRAVTFRLN